MFAKIIHVKVLSKLGRTPHRVVDFSFILTASLWKGAVRIGAVSRDAGEE